MVRSKSRLSAVLVLSLLVLTLAIAAAPAASAEEYRWQVNYQHVTLDINQSGTVSMIYQVDATIEKGVWNEVWIPATKSNMQISSVVDSTGKSHSYYIDGDQIKTRDYNLRPGDSISLTIYSTLPNFIYKSNAEGYDIVSFTPPWWDMPISDTSVKYVLPAEINVSEVYTGNREYSGIGTENGRTIVYFNSTQLSNNQQFDTAVSFPDRYMAPGVVTSKDDYTPPVYNTGGDDGVGSFLTDALCSTACLPFFIIAGIIILSLIASGNRQQYSSPVVSMDGVGVNKDLDPVEAAMLLRIDPRRILTMIMFDLLKKGNVKLISTEPIRLEPVARKDLNYYEAAFMDAIRNDTLDEDRLVKCFKVLAQRVVDKTRPFCRKDTEAYYRQKIEEKWDDVKAVDTPELKLQKYDTAMLWLMADEQFATRTKESLRAPGWNTMTIPPYYWWYPYYFGHQQPATTTTATTDAMRPQTGGTVSQPQQPTNQTTSSVEAFASKVSNSVETMSAGVVGSIESFLGVRNAANAPPAAPAPARQGGTSCACVSCACACAHCACACACAGGGGGCT
ncbi:hypothetical protein [Methanocella sp. MCL-LM]|uniref:hypothetical protein n=1 Tax=Methanocella sp. MCL-LM TaxID=3412035 RepID=UPI003C790904